MAVFDELPANDPRVGERVPAGQPGATADDGMVLILTGRYGDRWHFELDLPGAAGGPFSVEPDPDGARLHVMMMYVGMPSRDGSSMEDHAFREIGTALQRRLKDSIAALLGGWSAMGWNGRRCTFYD